jgi:N6-adenosine-specific RNA methylase IME4
MTGLDYLPRKYFGAILADPPWRFQTWSKKGEGRSASRHYPTMTAGQIAGLPVEQLAAAGCALFLWTAWPHLEQALWLIEHWGFTYKTNAFTWAKIKDGKPQTGTGYWTRANSEVCLLGTRGKPKRIAADVAQLIVEPRREHSRKPDCVHGRIERLVAGPYLELFARARRENWEQWGNELGKFAAGDHRPGKIPLHPPRARLARAQLSALDRAE